MSTNGCAPNVAYEELLAYMDAVAEETRRRAELLFSQRDAAARLLREAENELASLSAFVDFTATLRRQVEAGQTPVEVALAEMAPGPVKAALSEMVGRRFNSSEFVSSLYEHSVRKAS